MLGVYYSVHYQLDEENPSDIYDANEELKSKPFRDITVITVGTPRDINI